MLIDCKIALLHTNERSKTMTNLNVSNSNQLNIETAKTVTKKQRMLAKLNSYGKKLALSGAVRSK